MEQEEYTRYESHELIVWKKLTTDEQFEKVNALSKKYKDKLSVTRVKHQSIHVELSVPKNETYNTLVEYETYLRESLDNIPIIVLLQGKTDANKKRR